MRRRSRVLVLLVLLACPPLWAAEAPAAVRDALVAVTQRLMDALPSGDQTAWAGEVTDDAVIIDEFGRVASKADMLAALHPFPAGVTGSISMRDPHAWLHGDSALLSVEEYERENYYGQVFVVRYRALLNFVQRDGRWQLAGAEDVTLPTAPPELAVPGLQPADYVGRYRYAPGRDWTVTLDHGVLGYATRPGGSVHGLQAVARDVFMGTDDERNLLVFQRDAQGKVVALIERRKFNDLHLQRLP